VVDYRKLNAQTVRKVFPTQNLDEHLETLHGATLFTTLDLASGYLQVPLIETSKEKTAFITPSESGQFERMVFGLINAPYEFSSLMQRILRRAPTSMSQDTETELLDEHMKVFIAMTEEDQVIAMQQEDVKLKAIMSILSQEESEHTTTEAERVTDYQLHHGMLYREVTVDDNETRLLWVVPESMRKSIVVRFHD